MKLELIRYVLLYLEALHTGPEYKKTLALCETSARENWSLASIRRRRMSNLVLTDLCHPLNDSEVESKLLEATFDEVNATSDLL